MVAGIAYVLVGVTVISLLWGVACSIVGGVLKFNLATYVNEYIKDLDYEHYNEAADGLIKVNNHFDSVNLGNSPNTLGLIAMVVGILVIVYSLVGIGAGVTRQISLLFVLIGIILMCTMLEFIILWMIIDVNSSFHDSAKDDLAKTLSEKYHLGSKTNQFSELMNAIMIVGHCCGVRGASDFVNLTSDSMEFFSTSPACCKGSVWSTAESNPDIVRECALGRSDLAYKYGCYDALFEEASAGVMGTHMVLLIVIILWQCLIMAVSVIMLFQPKDDEATASGKQSAKSKHEEEAINAQEVAMKEFTPFSKLSSFQSSNINRIKSTEIW